ncbi:MAG: magnesium transporter [Rhodothermaceae bacterium]
MTKTKSNVEVKNIIQVDQELIDNISNLIETGADKSILNIISDLHPADIAEIINHLHFDEAFFVFNLLDTETAGDVITEVDENLREKILEEIDPDKITTIIDELETDDATDIISELPEEIQDQVLDNIDSESSEDVKELLKYPEDTAGGKMSSDFVFLYKDATVRDAIHEVRKNADDFDNLFYIYILAQSEKLVGVVGLKSLLIHPRNTPITEVMEEDLLYVEANLDQEEVAVTMEKYDLVAIPVVDENKVMVGRITIDDIVEVISEEAEEDIQKIAGLSDEQESSDSVFRISKIRLPWLFIALALEVLAAFILDDWQGSLKNSFASAIAFIPVVMAMGGSTGTQAAIVMVRGLSSGDIWLTESLKKLSKEFAVALINGIVLGASLCVITTFFFDENLETSLVVGFSLLLVIFIATMMGAIVPLILKKFDIDPATATGPFVTTTNDILGLIIYLSIITLYFVK